MRFSALAAALFFGTSVSAAAAPVGRAAFAGFDIRHFDYVEDISEGGESRETGVLPFLVLGVRLPLTDVILFEPSWRATFNAPTKFSGTDIGATESVEATDIHTVHELGVRGMFLATTEWSFYAGVEYRQWDRFLSYGSGYREIYRWWAIPAGARWSPAAAAGWAFDASVRWMARGTIDVIFTETVTNGEDTTLTPGNRPAFRLSALRTFVGAGRAWTLEPWLERSGFGRSDTKFNSTPTTNGILGDIAEPASATTRLGLSLSVDIPF